MSIRLIASDLYRFIREADRLKKEIAQTPYEKQEPLKEQLRKVNAEVRRMRQMLEGQKDRPLHPRIYR
ncbi:MAG: hypothetical protein V2I97_18485 [Desulfococcaceae bacterium]|jgi:hypothetical protein|nr:hypothetical protein [Desulfococcaceae bacterium]